MTRRGVVVSAVVMAVVGLSWSGAVGSSSPAGASTATYGSPATVIGPSVGPLIGTAVDAGGDVFVADVDHSRVLETTPAGVQTTVPFAGLVAPAGVAVDSSNDVFVVDRSTGRVVERSPGGVQTTWGFTGLSGPSALAVDAAGDVFVADSQNNRVVEMTPGGVQSTVPVTGLTDPLGVAVYTTPIAGFQEMFVTDPLAGRVVEVFMQNGSVTAQAAVLTGLSQPSGVAVDSFGDVFVTDSGNNRVLGLSTSGTRTTYGFSHLDRPMGIADSPVGLFVGDAGDSRLAELTWGGVEHDVSFPGLYQPFGVAVDAAGDVLVSDACCGANNDTFINRVVERSTAGVQTTLGFTGVNLPYGVAVDATGDVFVTDTGHGRVVELTPGGVQSTLGFTGLSNPWGVAVDGTGDVFVADLGNNRVEELTPGGTQSTLGFAGLAQPTAVAVDPWGDVFVADSLNHRVVELSRAGVQTTLGFTGLSFMYGLAVDRAGDVLVSDTGNGRVLRLTPDGVQSILGFTDLSAPWGLAVDAGGDVYVADDDNGRLVELPAQPTAPSFTSAAATTFTEGRPGSFVVVADGTPAPTFSEVGALPDGVVLAPTGVLSGTPTRSGTYPVTITAANGVGAPATQSFSLVVDAVGITTPSLPDGAVYSKALKNTYTATLSASGGNAPYKWSLAPGSAPLPPGLKLKATGVVSGKATTAGTYTFVVRVTDKKTKTKPPTQNTATATYSVTIAP